MPPGQRAGSDDTIVITGLGAVTALGASVAETWDRVLRGERAFAPITLFRADDYRVRIVAEVPDLPREGGPDFSRTSELAVRAAREALGAAELSSTPRRVGLVVGGTTAGMLQTESTLSVLLSPEGEVDPAAREEALRRMLTHPLSAPSDRLARELGPFTRVRSLSSACSSGANAMLVGATWLRLGLCDVVLAGAADALCRVTLSGFNALGALDPDGARPFDRRRRGLTLGEGAGFVVLERRAHAVARGKVPVCTLLGWSARAEAHHITNPEPNGLAPSRAMEAALARAGLAPADVDYVNAHGTGTPLNDPMETRALARVFREDLSRVAVSSQKGQFGHTLAAAGAIEATLTALAIDKGILPPTGGLEEPDPECGLSHVRSPEKREIRAALSSSFGFGGMDTVLVFGRRDMSSPPAPARRRVVVTGAAAITPGGLFEGARTAELAGGEAPPGDAIGPELSGHLDLERARRLDRASRLAAIACGGALGAAPPGSPGAASHDSVRDAGVVLGNAFGSVDGTAAFMRRLREKGARLASPADFPSLVPSSPAGHVSIYLGLTGPTLVVADLGTSGECALTQACELVASSELDRVVVCAVEEKSAIVDQVFRVLFGPDRKDEADPARPPRREGAGAVALAAEDVAAARGLPVLATVEQALAWAHDAAVFEDLEPPPSAGRGPGEAVVVIGAPSSAVLALLDRSPWAAVRRVQCSEQSGSHEGVGGIAIAVASAMLSREGGPGAALCIGSARGWGYAVRLERPPAGSRGPSR